MDILRELIEDMQKEITTLKTMQQQQPIRVSFNGKQNINSNNECPIYNTVGISKVVRQSAGQYIIHFEKAMSNNHYTVLLTANMWNTGGLIIGLEGNNRKGDTYYTQKEECFTIGTRCPRSNSRRDCDLVHVVVYP